MANSRSANIIHCDTATAAASTDLNLKVAELLFTTDNANDAFELRETSGGSSKITVKHATADDTKHIQFQTPIVFSQGIYVQSLSAGAKLMIILASERA